MTPKEGYLKIVGAAAASLGVSEYWCIDHAQGPLLDTRSKNIARPIQVFCEVLNIDWDAAREQGYFINRITLESALLEGETT